MGVGAPLSVVKYNLAGREVAGGAVFDRPSFEYYLN